MVPPDSEIWREYSPYLTHQSNPKKSFYYRPPKAKSNLVAIEHPATDYADSITWSCEVHKDSRRTIRIVQTEDLGGTRRALIDSSFRGFGTPLAGLGWRESSCVQHCIS